MNAKPAFLQAGVKSVRKDRKELSPMMVLDYGLAIATASIEILRFDFGRPTMGVERAGGLDGKYSAYSPLRISKWSVLQSHTVVFTT